MKETIKAWAGAVVVVAKVRWYRAVQGVLHWRRSVVSDLIYTMEEVGKNVDDFEAWLDRKSKT